MKTKRREPPIPGAPTVYEDAPKVTPNIVVNDPSSLTTTQLLREIGHVTEWVETYVGGETNLVNERLTAVDNRFKVIEEQRVEQKSDTKEAVGAALAAAKEAVQEQTKASAEAILKTETLTAQALKQQSEQYKDGLQVLGDKLDDLKERVIRVETQRVASLEAVSEQRNIRIEDRGDRSDDRGGYQQVMSLAALLLAVLSMLIAAGIFK